MNQAPDKDVCFDELQPRFSRNVYQTGKGRVRLELTKADLLRSFPELENGDCLRILDAGAGMGQIAIWLAGLGHQVTMADISAEMLDQARREIEAAELQSRVTIVEASIQSLPELLNGQKFDLILLHGVIAWMEKPLQAISCLAELLREKGRMSVLYFNKDKLIMKWGITGQIDSAISGKGRRKGSLTPINPLSFAEVEKFCHEQGYKIVSKAGIRVFYRFFLKFPEKYTCSLEDYIKLELQYCRTEPYASLGEHTHIILSCA